MWAGHSLTSFCPPGDTGQRGMYVGPGKRNFLSLRQTHLKVFRSYSAHLGVKGNHKETRNQLREKQAEGAFLEIVLFGTLV